MIGKPRLQFIKVRVDVRSELIAAPISPLVNPIDVFSYTRKIMVVIMPDTIDKQPIKTISLAKPKATTIRSPTKAPITNPDTAIIPLCIFHPIVAIIKPIIMIIIPAIKFGDNKIDVSPQNKFVFKYSQKII